MIDTTDLDSYYPGYDDYCEVIENNEEYNDYIIDNLIDEAILEKGE